MNAQKGYAEQDNSVGGIVIAAFCVGVVMASVYTFLSGWNWWLWGWSIIGSLCVGLLLVGLCTLPVYRPEHKRISPFFWPVLASVLTPPLVVYLTTCLERVGLGSSAQVLYHERIGLAAVVLVSGIVLVMVGDWWRRVGWWRPSWVAAVVFISYMLVETVRQVVVQWWQKWTSPTFPRTRYEWLFFSVGCVPGLIILALVLILIGQKYFTP